MNSAYEWVNKRTRPAKPKNKTMKYRTIVHFHNIPKGVEIEADSGVYAHNIIYDFNNDKWKANPNFLRNNEHLFEPVDQVQEGDWIYSEYIDRCFRVAKEKDMTGANRVIFPDDMGNKKYTTTFDLTKSGYRKATTDEIEQALVKEAKRRFSKGDIVETKENNFGNHQEEEPFKVTFDDLDYEKGREQLYDGNILLYDSGEWAEKIDQTPDIEINGYEAEFHEDYVKFGCAKIDRNLICRMADYFSEPFTGNGNKSVNGVKIGEGLFTIEELNEIADYYKKEESGINIVGEPVEVSGIGFSASNMWGNDD